MPSDGPITVIGATGQQGGAVIDTLLKQRIPIRAVTRNPNGDKARRKASVIRTSANGQPAVALYTGSHDGKRRLHSLHVLTVAAQGVSRVVAFQDIGAVRRFDLPASRS